jgi:hypothetical protein
MNILSCQINKNTTQIKVVITSFIKKKNYNWTEISNLMLAAGNSKYFRIMKELTIILFCTWKFAATFPELLRATPFPTFPQRGRCFSDGGGTSFSSLGETGKGVI